MKQYLFTILFFSLLIPSFGQNLEMKGFAVMQTGDTLKGYFQLLSPEEQLNICKYKPNSVDNTWKTLKPNEVAYYRLENGQKFVARVVDTINNVSPIFIEHVIDGTLRLYYYSNEDRDHYFVDKDSLGLREITKELKDYNVDGKMYRSSSNLDENLLRYYTKECPELISKIQDIKMVSRSSISNIVMRYNEKVGGKVSYKLFQKEIIKKGINIELAGGELFIPPKDDLLDRTLPSYGLFAEFGLFRHNPNWYFRTGLLLSKSMRVLNFYEEGMTRVEWVDRQPIFIIPLEVHYISPKKFGYIVGSGVHLASPTLGPFLRVTANLGVKYDLSKKVGIKLNGYYSYCGKFLIIPKDISSYYGINLGLSIKIR
jgi:hypothetical protein